jgi:hypothetical protein
MAKRLILLDSNSYFRLAKSINPLLGVDFGHDPCCLHVIPALEKEFNNSPRLKNKFGWVNDSEFKENRKNSLILDKAKRKSISTTAGFIKKQSIENKLGLSDIDTDVLATGYILKISVVTDDEAMLEVADIFEIKTMKSLNLLKLMCEANHIDVAKVKQIMAYWQYEKDVPKNCNKDFQLLFNEHSTNKI